jgi:hypothetical protein
MMRTTLGAIVLCASASAATLEITGECHAWQPLPGSSELTLLHSSEDPSCRPYAPGFIMYWFERRLKLDSICLPSCVLCEIGGLKNSLDKSSGFGYRRVG